MTKHRLTTDYEHGKGHGARWECGLVDESAYAGVASRVWSWSPGRA